MTTLQAIILSIVEGLTEYLPISSTGHMIITAGLLGIPSTDFVKNFTVVVQFGAILSVLVLYWRRFLVAKEFYYKLFFAFIPAAVIGLALGKRIDALLGDAQVVGISLIAGGIVLLGVDRYFAAQEKSLETADAGKIESLSYLSALVIGFFQCVALIPGVSRSATTIIGGLSRKLTRQAAAEFSFFLAVPTLTAATCYKLLKSYQTIDSSQISLLVIGNVISFIVGMMTIKLFIGYLTRRGFFYFGIYRIIAGAVVLILLATGHSLSLL
jgi:undecaprenyl-diphosphatase